MIDPDRVNGISAAMSDEFQEDFEELPADFAGTKMGVCAILICKTLITCTDAIIYALAAQKGAPLS